MRLAIWKHRSGGYPTEYVLVEVLKRLPGGARYHDPVRVRYIERRTGNWRPTTAYAHNLKLIDRDTREAHA